MTGVWLPGRGQLAKCLPCDQIWPNMAVDLGQSTDLLVDRQRLDFPSASRT